MASRRFREAVDIFREGGGILRMAAAVQAGISRKTLYAMRDEGVLDQLSRGVYRLASLPGLASPDLVAVATRVPNGAALGRQLVKCQRRDQTGQVPHAVDVAIARGAERPRIDYPPINVYSFSDKAFGSGIETPMVDGRESQTYSAEESVADAFKYRGKIGMDVALEAQRSWRRRRRANVERLLECVRLCRVERVMRPYLEAIA